MPRVSSYLNYSNCIFQIFFIDHFLMTYLLIMRISQTYNYSYFLSSIHIEKDKSKSTTFYLYQQIFLCNYFKQTISMNNKFWNAPAWSMANRYAGKSTNKNEGKFIPGPGTYDVRGNGNPNGCTMGTSTRGLKDRENQPGPGNYNISSKIDGPKISLANRFGNGALTGSSYTPGPGNYNTATAIARPGSGVTIGAKYSSSKNLNQEPGPGSYNLGADKKPGVKIGTSNRTNLGGKGENPGPGQYTYDQRPSSAGPKYGFGKSGKGASYGDFAPGPGQYDSNSFIKGGDNNGCTMGYKFYKKGDSVDLGPGPGYYDYGTKNHSSGVKIGKAQRGGLDSGISPGPGAYYHDNKSLHGAKIGTSKRGQFGRSQTPGPGSYGNEIIRQHQGGVTISGHRSKLKQSNVPGPGSYNPDQYSKGRPCSANMGQSLRGQMGKSYTPGPGQYYKGENQNYKFAYTKEIRSKDLKRGDPGPGQYQIPHSVPSAPHYLIDPKIYKSVYGSHY